MKIIFDALDAIPLVDFYAGCLAFLAAIVLVDVRVRRSS